MMTPALIHIGGAKTASTSFQRGVLASAATVHHFGEVGDGVTTAEEEQLVRSLLTDDDVFYDSTGVKELFTRHMDLAGPRRLVFSSADVLLAHQPTLIAARLRELVGAEADVLLVVRDQVKALSSFYSGHGAWLKSAPQPHYRRFVAPGAWMDFALLSPSTSALAAFSYWDQLQPFLSEFGRSNVHVVTFESLTWGPGAAWKEIGDLLEMPGDDSWRRFSGLHDRERISIWQKRYGQLASHARPFASPPDVRSLAAPLAAILDRGRKFVPEWDGEIIDRLHELYAAGNSRLAREFGLDLRGHGYLLPTVEEE